MNFARYANLRGLATGVVIGAQLANIEAWLSGSPMQSWVIRFSTLAMLVVVFVLKPTASAPRATGDRAP